MVQGKRGQAQRSKFCRANGGGDMPSSGCQSGQRIVREPRLLRSLIRGLQCIRKDSRPVGGTWDSSVPTADQPRVATQLEHLVEFDFW
jgi:hypothetical protein